MIPLVRLDKVLSFAQCLRRGYHNNTSHTISYYCVHFSPTSLKSIWYRNGHEWRWSYERRSMQFCEYVYDTRFHKLRHSLWKCVNFGHFLVLVGSKRLYSPTDEVRGSQLFYSVKYGLSEDPHWKHFHHKKELWDNWLPNFRVLPAMSCNPIVLYHTKNFS